MDVIKTYLGQLTADVIANILLGLVILLVGLKLTKWLVKLLSKLKGIQHLDVSVQSFVQSFVKIVLYALVISSAAICWGVPATSFMTMFASAGVAIGLALQGALSNFAGGLMILFFKPFKVGDYIEGNGVSGTVKDITVIYTILTTPDNKTITIPNGSLTSSNVINYSTQPQRRLDLTFSAGYEDDVEKVKAVLLEVANAHEKVLKDPAPMARLAAHNASSLDYYLRVWVNPADYWDVNFDLMEQVKAAFDKNSISIPYQQIDIFMKK